VIVFFFALGAAAWLLFGRAGGRDAMWRGRYADEERHAEEGGRRFLGGGAGGGSSDGPSWASARRARSRRARPIAPDDDLEFLSELDERIRRERGNK
jgi:hypothetical protein